jgi:hypothetical protein
MFGGQNENCWAAFDVSFPFTDATGIVNLTDSLFAQATAISPGRVWGGRDHRQHDPRCALTLAGQFGTCPPCQR